MEKEVSPKDTIRVVRIALKCADALVDFDVINDLIEDKKAKYVKHDLKDSFIKSISLIIIIQILYHQQNLL